MLTLSGLSACTKNTIFKIPSGSFSEDFLWWDQLKT